MTMNHNRSLELKPSHKATILIIGPTPPPYMGPSVATKMIINSELKERFNLLHLDTSDRRSITNIGKIDFSNIYLVFLHIFKLFGFLIKYSPRIVYLPICQTVRGYLRDAIFIILSKIFGARVVIHLRGGYFRKLYEKSNIFAQLVIKYSLKFVSRAIVLGKTLRYIFEGFVPSERIVVVPNGIDADYITRQELNKARKNKMNQINETNQKDQTNQINQINKIDPSESASSNGTLSTKHYAQSSKFRILFLSNLLLEKGFFDVIKAIPIVTQLLNNSIIEKNTPSPLMGEGKGEGEITQLHNDSITSLEFIFAGAFRENKSTKEKIEQFINDNNLNSHINFIGTTTGQEKRNLLLSSDILVFPTYYKYEGQPWVIIEAMAAGLPIITTDKGCVKEMVIDGENGFIVDKQNPQQIAEKIILLLKDNKLRNQMGAKSRQRFLKYYTKDKFITGLTNVFTDVYLKR